MPIRPPKLDDRKYADIVREARTLIPQYCPEWTNLGDADPGMTLVQLFAWMTEMTIFRLNRVPDKTYVHFLNFIGEERRRARPSKLPVTFGLRGDERDSAEIPPFSRCSAKAEGGGEQLQFLTTDHVTVHGANVTRIVSVNAGNNPMVREIPFDHHPEHEKGLLFNGGRGIRLLQMDPIAHGPTSYTPQQYLYVAHDDFRLMDFELEEGQSLGRLRIRSATADNLPVGAIFKWEYYAGEEDGWLAVGLSDEEEEILGLPEIALDTHLPGLVEVTELGDGADPFPVPKDLQEEKYWIRGTVDYERWLAHRMQEDLEIAWRDDRGAEERPINNWEVRATGRNLEFFIQDMPPIRGGWTVHYTMVDRSMPAGRGQYIPRYRWLYRRGDSWEEIPHERVRHQDTSVILTGPLTDMATDGFNLRAERIETVNLRGFVPELDLDITWMRPVELFLGSGPETSAAAAIDTAELPTLPFQPANTLPPLLGMKFFIGTDLFENRAQKPVLVEIEVDFEWQDESLAEPDELYHMQLCYRAADTWRVVYDRKGTYTQFTFKQLDEEGALKAGRRKIRFKLNPKTQLKGLHRAIIAGQETTWLRLELTKAQLTKRVDKKTPPTPVTLKIYSVKLGVDGVMGKDVYEQPLPGPKMVSAEYRRHNRRLTRSVARVAGRLSEDYPFDTFIDIEDAAAKSTGKSKAKTKEELDIPVGHQAVYFQFDRALPSAQRHAILFKCRGETFLPEGEDVSWELLESGGRGRSKWARLTGTRDDDAGEAFLLNRTGSLAFSYPDAKKPAPEGHWMRVLFRSPKDPEVAPALPPLSHMMLNTVEAVNLHAFRMERFSGLGVPHQSVQLRRFPIFLHGEDGEEEVFDRPERFPDLRLFVTEGDGQRREWRKAPGNSILMASKDDRVFVVDPVDGTITFGNGIRGKMVPVGTYNIAVEVYHTIPGTAGNISPGGVASCDGFSDVVNVTNLLPATGGRNSESIEEIIRRAPSVLTSRDRAVTRLDFEVIAAEASAEVARAACSGEMAGDGEVEVVVLPRRREGEQVPDPFLAGGLKDHVQQYLARRCLVNVQPVVRLATFQKVDVSIVLRLRANTNLLQVRDRAQAWIARFLDPYFGGLDADGWPFGATLYAEDFGRMVTDIPEVRHIMDVEVYAVGADDDEKVPGWEAGRGSRTLVLESDDLFQVRNIRVRAEGVQ
ncbi:MAG: baseplate J/gp47 family protein [Proteobacteria bacterium]|nr:baseplate J/gp47 family protein [Pseudomonadota bacterium]